MMAANIEECTQDAVVAAYRYDRFTSYARGNELPRFGNLIDTPDHLPCLAEDRIQLQIRNPFIDIPRRRDRIGVSEWRLVVISCKNLVDSQFPAHAFFPWTFSDPIARRRRSVNCSILASFFSVTG